MNNDTIAAVATAMSDSGIGIVRISGDDAFDIIDRIFEKKNKKYVLSEQKSHTIHYGHIIDQNNLIDEVMVSIMRNPNTYTREDCVEINCHGGVHVTRRVLETVLKYGARLAEPGEFTKRAFLNGRIDLSQAEAVIDIIHSKNDLALKSSLNQLEGSIYKKIKEVRESLIYQIAFIESALDDPEHSDLSGFPQQLEQIVDNCIADLDQLLKTAENGRILKEGIQTVILGKPNAGKSSLLNVLSGKERAIVTDIEGTTRDALEENIILDGIMLNVIDTAGIRNTEDIVEKIGVEKAKEYAQQADLILYVADGSKSLDKSDEDIISILDSKKGIVLLNKSDLDLLISEDEMEKITGKKVITISAKEQKGINVLTEELKEMFFQGEVSFNDQIYITNIRHKKALEEARSNLKMVNESIEMNLPEDFYSIDLMGAYKILGTIIGESVEEDLVNEIFSKFCTGK